MLMNSEERQITRKRYRFLLLTVGLAAVAMLYNIRILLRDGFLGSVEFMAVKDVLLVGFVVVMVRRWRVKDRVRSLSVAEASLLISSAFDYFFLLIRNRF